MHQKVLTCTLLFLIVLGLQGCGDSEKKAQLELDRAQALQQTGEMIEAEELFRDIVLKYPKTAVDTTARLKLDELARAQQAARKTLVDTLESLVQVFEGYRSLYGGYPQALEDLDTSGYFFDSAYMAEVVPEAVTVYLVLDGDAQRFLLWAFDENMHFGVSTTGVSHLENFFGNEAIENLLVAYRPVLRLGNLISLVPADNAL